MYISDIIAVSCGDFHTLALNNIGEVYAWGKSTLGQLGIPLSLKEGSSEHHIRTL